MNCNTEFTGADCFPKEANEDTLSEESMPSYYHAGDLDDLIFEGVSIQRESER